MPKATPPTPEKLNPPHGAPGAPRRGARARRLPPAACVAGVAVRLGADRSPCWAGLSILRDYLFVTAGEWWHSA